MIQNIINWETLSNIRNSSSSIKTINSHVESILCGSDSHSDEFHQDMVLYKIPNRIYYKKSIESMRNNYDMNLKIDLYRKLGPNKWSYLGKFFVSNIDNNSNSEYTIITLRSSTSK